MDRDIYNQILENARNVPLETRVITIEMNMAFFKESLDRVERNLSKATWLGIGILFSSLGTTILLLFQTVAHR